MAQAATDPTLRRRIDAAILVARSKGGITTGTAESSWRSLLEKDFETMAPILARRGVGHSRRAAIEAAGWPPHLINRYAQDVARDRTLTPVTKLPVRDRRASPPPRPLA